MLMYKGIFRSGKLLDTAFLSQKRLAIADIDAMIDKAECDVRYPPADDFYVYFFRNLKSSQNHLHDQDRRGFLNFGMGSPTSRSL